MYSWTCPDCGSVCTSPEAHHAHIEFGCNTRMVAALKAYARAAVTAMSLPAMPQADGPLPLTDRDRAFLRDLRIDGNK